jgi:hypothetical protein
MPAVRIDEVAFVDPRFTVFGDLCGCPKKWSPSWALGACAKLWAYCTQSNSYVLSDAIVAVTIGFPSAADRLCQAGLAERVTDSLVRIKGTKTRIEWLARLRENSEKGSRARRKQAVETSEPECEPSRVDEESKRPRKKDAGHAIPTVYNNIVMRSRLEARWAAFFDLSGWRWVYEPVDLPGYIPDFAVYLPTREVLNESGEEPTEVYLVEVKPALVVEELMPAAEKMDAAGWHGFGYILGASPGVSIVANGPQTGKIGERWEPIGEDDLGGERLRNIRWNSAGNSVQWRSPSR